MTSARWGLPHSNANHADCFTLNFFCNARYPGHTPRNQKQCRCLYGITTLERDALWATFTMVAEFPFLLGIAGLPVCNEERIGQDLR